MNFDKASKSGKKKIFLAGVGEREGGGGAGVEKGASSLGKYIFPIYKYIITYRISSSYFMWFTSFKTNKRSNRQERDRTPKIFYGIHSKVKEVILTLILSHMPNIRILAQAVLKISC